MNVFLKSAKAKGYDRNKHIKKAITTQLSETIKEIQLCGIEENILSDSLDIEEATNSLCCVIEAMFLHGLKDSLTLRFRRVIADVDDRPDPSFWAPLLVISHKEIIKQITDATQINTEIGYCRAWVRVVLNDCLLSSYLLTLRQDLNILKSFYHTHAYIRDADLLEVAQKIIEGLEAVKNFILPCYSSILNTWPQSTLALAGIWSPTLRMCPVQTCVDVAQVSQPTSIGNSETASLGSLMSLHSRSSGIGNILAFNEDEAFKIILKKRLLDERLNADSQERSVSETSSDQEQKIPNKDDKTNNGESQEVQEQNVTLGNSLNRQMGWSFDETHREEPEEPGATASDETPIEDSSKSLERSYNALIQSYSMLGGAYVKTPDVKEVWAKFENKEDSNFSDTNDTHPKDNILTVSESNNENSKNASMMQLLVTIPREKGLDRQDYKCKNCKTSISIFKSAKGITNFANVCCFTGEYFCNDCMCDTPVLIPARVIHNWDYREYRISWRAYHYLEEIKDYPMIDLKTINPFIYGVVEEMAQLQTLRNQLNFLRAYLYTCRDPVIEEFQKLFPREYMYEHIHLYSILDLQQIPDLKLAKELEEVVNFGKKHVLDCWLCSHKGFLCELCNSSKVIFPFDVENVYRCETCNAVFHNTCLNATKPCPKCKRMKERQDLSLLGVATD